MESSAQYGLYRQDSVVVLILEDYGVQATVGSYVKVGFAKETLESLRDDQMQPSCIAFMLCPGASGQLLELFRVIHHYFFEQVYVLTDRIHFVPVIPISLEGI